MGVSRNFKPVFLKRGLFKTTSRGGRNHPLVRHLSFWIFYLLQSILIVVFYNIVSNKLEANQNDYQPAFALILIFLRELNAWVTRTVISNTARGDESGAQGFGTLTVEMILCITFGTNATIETEVLLMGLDFMYNIYLCIKIVWSKRRRPEDIEKQINWTEELAISELVEFIAPLSYILAFISAYYGPNGELLIQIRATIWEQEPIEDAPEFVMIVLLFFFVDFCSAITASLVLWFYCKINFFAVLVATEEEYGAHICVVLSHMLFTVI